MNFSDILQQSQWADGQRTFVIPDGWMQGRTTYGGLTTALCMSAAAPLADGRPVRSVQVAFVGPVNGQVTCRPTILRSGRNASFISVRMESENGIVAETIFAFGSERASSLEFSLLRAPDTPRPENSRDMFPERNTSMSFTNHFDMRLAAGDLPCSGGKTPDTMIWLRHRDPDVPIDALSVIALADAPPPAVLSIIDGPAPVSSMTWMAEFLTDDFTTEDGWFLAHHHAQASQNGYSSQAMTLYTSTGRPVVTGRQTIAVFR